MQHPRPCTRHEDGVWGDECSDSSALGLNVGISLEFDVVLELNNCGVCKFLA